MSICLFNFPDRVYLCNPVCTGSSSIDQANMELTVICLPLPLGWWNKRCVPPVPSLNLVFKERFNNKKHVTQVERKETLSKIVINI